MCILLLGNRRLNWPGASFPGVQAFQMCNLGVPDSEGLDPKGTEKGSTSGSRYTCPCASTTSTPCCDTRGCDGTVPSTVRIYIITQGIPTRPPSTQMPSPGRDHVTEYCETHHFEPLCSSNLDCESGYDSVNPHQNTHGYCTIP